MRTVDVFRMLFASVLLAASLACDANAAEFQVLVPAASVEVVPSGHNVQEEIPADLGARLRTAAGKG